MILGLVMRPVVVEASLQQCKRLLVRQKISELGGKLAAIEEINWGALRFQRRGAERKVLANSQTVAQFSELPLHKER